MLSMIKLFPKIIIDENDSHTDIQLNNYLSIKFKQYHLYLPFWIISDYIHNRIYDLAKVLLNIKLKL